MTIVSNLSRKKDPWKRPNYDLHCNKTLTALPHSLASRPFWIFGLAFHSSERSLHGPPHSSCPHGFRNCTKRIPSTSFAWRSEYLSEIQINKYKNRISKASAKGQALINERSCALKKHVGQTLEHVLPTCLSARGPHACSGMMPERRSSQVLFICEAMRKLDLSYPESNFQTAVAATQSH